ncbi:hypothetical protein lerEdw1_002544 [Lerista edwardsae]|nr:hypothetical protein lerEdw1_002544 [Lerista edwardsae]
MDVEINWVSDDDICGIGEGNSDKSTCTNEWEGQKASLQLDIKENLSPPSIPNSSPAGPSDQQDLPVELHCEEEEAHSLNCQWRNSTTAGVFITSSANFDLQCEDEGSELRSLDHARGVQGRPSKNGDVSISDPFDEEELAPTSEVVLPYCCKKCGEMFHDLGMLQEHQQYHSSMAKHPYQCPICSKEFFRTANLRLHRLIHSSDKPYKCPECDKGFIHKVDFWRHLQNVHKDLGLQSSDHYKDPHTLSGEEENFIILVDNSDNENLPPLPYQCKKCEKSFQELCELQEHKKLHMPGHSYKCPICGKEFFRAANLRMHKLIHSSNRPHKCPECDKGFIRTADVWRHLCRMHKIERSSVVLGSANIKNPWSVLQENQEGHLNSKQLDSAVGDPGEETSKQYLCPICNKGFHKSNLLSKHKVNMLPCKQVSDKQQLSSIKSLKEES